MPGRRILVIEDDNAIRQGIVDALSFHGFLVAEAADGNAGLAAALANDCDLVLLDLILPGMLGMDVLKELRAAHPTLPVIILTAKGEEQDRINGLRAGADDYVVKPFSIKELLARIDAVLRRSPERPSDIARIGIQNATIDLARAELRFADGSRSELSEREVELLAYLARNRGRAISREEILSRIWKLEPRGVDTRTIDMHVARLREKLRDDATQPRIILTVRGKGYMFAQDHPS